MSAMGSGRGGGWCDGEDAETQRSRGESGLGHDRRELLRDWSLLNHTGKSRRVSSLICQLTLTLLLLLWFPPDKSGKCAVMSKEDGV